MKIAVFEPYPRLCGVTTWAFNVVHGFRSLGYDTDVVTFTVSGRTRAIRGKSGGPRLTWQWYPEAPDVTAKWTDAADVLKQYDLIVLNEPKNGPLDREAQQSESRPLYIDALEHAGVPWTTAIHDVRSYDSNRAPFLHQCFRARGFTGFLVQCRPGAFDSARYAMDPHVNKVLTWPWLPYRRKWTYEEYGGKRLRLATMGTRVTNHKGFTSFVDVADDSLPTNWGVELFGAESGGTGPCHTYVVYEALARNHGWRGERLGNGTQMDEIGNMASVQSPYRWHLEQDGHHIRYTGPYLDVLEPWSRAAIAIHLSTDQVVTTLEYATLESMDAGCYPIWPAYYTRDSLDVPYVAINLHEYKLGSGIRKKTIQWNDPPTARMELVKALQSAVDVIESGGWDPEINWRVIDQYHDPAHLADAILKGV